MGQWLFTSQRKSAGSALAADGKGVNQEDSLHLELLLMLPGLS